MDVISQIPGQVMEMVGEFVSQPVFGDLNVLGISQYSFWMFVAIAILLVTLFVFQRKQAASLAPEGKFVNAVEWVIDYVRENMVEGILGPTWKKHFPFIATVFFFVLINNIMGLIPGLKPGTGTIGTTFAVALCSFIYFLAVGIRRLGAWGYLKSLMPEGVPCPLNYAVWVIEIFSTFLRLITLAVRLFCNMFAGHVVMGAFAIMTTLFFGQLGQGVTGATLAAAAPSIAWVLILIIIYAVEVLVAVIQAYVFALLSSVYIQGVEGEE